MIYRDYISVIHNTQQIESTFKKKSNSTCYHAIREYVAMKENLTGQVPSVDNPSDICGGAKQKHLIGKVLHDL